VLFLDEPTTGLDPRGRADMWGVIAELVHSGVTLLVTTQYLEEADRLADSIAVIDHGKVIARGTADELKLQVGGETLEIVAGGDEQLAAATAVLRGLGSGAPVVEPHTRRISVVVTRGATSLLEAVRELDDRSVKLLDIGLHRRTLDDVFLALTGHTAAEADAAETDPCGCGQGRGRMSELASESMALRPLCFGRPSGRGGAA
jgi:ABC-2 type transport system ATP-binding protein